MTLSKEEMHNEFAYNMTMAHVKNLLKMGLITTDEYRQINQKYKKKYRPVSDGLASYCRVSTDDVDQAVSIALQIKEYKEKIKSNPNWKYVGTYVDDGFSGTNTEHRQGFQKLMADAMDGKIDLIITKAVSRFARNLMDCIVWVEALQNHDPPVRIYFEQENLDTMRGWHAFFQPSF